MVGTNHRVCSPENIPSTEEGSRRFTFISACVEEVHGLNHLSTPAEGRGCCYAKHLLSSTRDNPRLRAPGWGDPACGPLHELSTPGVGLNNVLDYIQTRRSDRGPLSKLEARRRLKGCDLVLEANFMACPRP